MKHAIDNNIQYTLKNIPIRDIWNHFILRYLPTLTPFLSKKHISQNKWRQNLSNYCRMYIYQNDKIKKILMHFVEMDYMDLIECFVEDCKLHKEMLTLDVLKNPFIKTVKSCKPLYCNMFLDILKKTDYKSLGPLLTVWCKFGGNDAKGTILRLIDMVDLSNSKYKQPVAHALCLNDMFDVFKSLVAKGYDIDVKDILKDIASDDMNVEIAEVLLEIGGSFDSGALFEACSAGAEEMTKLLLEDGEEDPEGMEAQCLVAAIEEGHSHIVQLLVNDGRICSDYIRKGISLAKYNNMFDIHDILMRAYY